MRIQWNVQFEGRISGKEGNGIEMNDEELSRGIEAILLVAVEPISDRLLAELLEEPVERIEEVCDRLARSYVEQNRGFLLARIAAGLRYQTHPDMASFVERFANRDVSHRLSTAALETLAIVAYRQPVSRAQISALRGVNVDGVARLLEQRGYISEVGRSEGPGQAVLFGTTDLFLERLGLNSLSDLPAVEDFLPGPEVVGELEEILRSAVGSELEDVEEVEEVEDVEEVVSNDIDGDQVPSRELDQRREQLEDQASESYPQSVDSEFITHGNNGIGDHSVIDG